MHTQMTPWSTRLSKVLSESFFGADRLIEHAHFGLRHIQCRIDCANKDLRSHFLKNVLRTIIVIRARARWFGIARGLFSNTNMVISDADSVFVLLCTHVFTNGDHSSQRTKFPTPQTHNI